ncbi:MAG: helix-turn-helix domain-containing protein, partial [Solirubrobacteraceae bacterium]
MADEVVTLGSVIAKARKAKGLTQKELAGLVGYGPSGVSVAKIEAGAITVPSELKLEALAEALELDVQELRALAERQPKRGAFNLPALHKRNEKKRA